ESWRVHLAPHSEGRHTVVEAEESEWSVPGSILQNVSYSNDAARGFELRVGEEVSTVIHFEADAEVQVCVAVDVGPHVGIIQMRLDSLDGGGSVAEVELDARRARRAAYEVGLSPQPARVHAGAYRLTLTVKD